MNLRKGTRIIIIVLSVATYLVTLGLVYDAYRIDFRTTKLREAEKEYRRKAAIAELQRRSVQADGEKKNRFTSEALSLEGQVEKQKPFQTGGEIATRDIFDEVATEQLQKQKSPYFFEYLFQGTLIATGIVVAIWAIYLILFCLIIWFYKASNRHKRMRVLWLGILIFILIGLFPPTDRDNYGFMGSYSKFEFLFDTSSKNIAFGKLLIMWLAVTAVTGGLLYTLKDKEPKDN